MKSQFARKVLDCLPENVEVHLNIHPKTKDDFDGIVHELVEAGYASGYVFELEGNTEYIKIHAPYSWDNIGSSNVFVPMEMRKR